MPAPMRWRAPGSAGRIVVDRLRDVGISQSDLRCELIGVDAIHGGRLSDVPADSYETRLRVAARVASLEAARHIGNEVEGLYTNGPAGGAGAVKTAREALSIASTYVPRDLVTCSVHLEVV